MTTRHRWQPAEDALLRKLYPNMPTAKVAARLGLSITKVYSRAYALGVCKSPAFLVQQNTAMMHLGRKHPAVVAHQFQPGIVPWNKGRSYQAGGRSAATWFAKGSKPFNYQPVGSYRITPDGILQRKISETPGPTHLRWKAVARLVWEEAHGPVPRGSMVVFKPGMRTTVLEQITLDKLECITRGENARRNHPRSKHPELARLVAVKGAITRQVNRITREHNERKTTGEANP